MKKTTIKKYAKLIANVGANVQKGQSVLLCASVENYEFATMVAEECYKLGAKHVEMQWMHQPIDKLAIRYETLKFLSTVQTWQEEKLKLMVKELPCRIFLESDDPDGLKGVNVEKMQKSGVARRKITKPYRDAIESLHQWTIAGVPSVAWAKKVFPGEKKSVAVEKLWQAILESVRVTDDNDPVAEWAKHNEDIRCRCEWLTKKKFDYVTYKSSNGTDFRCELIPRGIWAGGGERTKQGVFFNPNMPTEEVFTSPMKGKCEGTLVATKPLSTNGQLIENFSIRFENGKAVEWHAEKGEELLGKLITMDEGASQLGELALIPCDSPINNSGILYYSTLFDENAACHVALGFGFPDCIEGHMDMTLAECQALGVNDSMLHLDFMIGAPDMKITGYKNGKATPIFVDGEWAK